MLNDPMDYNACYAALAATAAAPWLDSLPRQVEVALDPVRHGHLAEWQQILQALPVVPATVTDLNHAAVLAGADGDEATRAQVESLLRRLHPWRKGPFSIHGIHIDTEWRSDWKWDRLAPHLAPLAGRTVLDVGCGNGYHCWRMAGAGAKQVFGIDPTLISVIQFHAIRHFVGKSRPVWVLPVGVEALAPKLHAFDTVFSMGVLYHRRSPLDHLLELHGCLQPGGELVLETLIIDGRQGEVLVPEGRYARMRNVWFIPARATLESWLRRCGFRAVRLVDVTTVTVAEQRSTAWMQFESLARQLDPRDPTRTVEGYPAPRRAIFLAQA